MGWIDCDAHVLENDATWDYLEPAEREFRPRRADFTNEEAPGLRPSFWFVGDTWSRAVAPDGNTFGNANSFADGTLLMAEPALRIEDLDALGIDVQILISTFFIGTELDHPLLEAALCRSYNRWMADRCCDTSGRFRWLLRPPLRMMDRAFEELEFGARNGAGGIHLKGIEHGYYLSDPQFFPLYERAQDLDLPILVHIGAATRRVDHLPVGRLVPTPAALTPQLASVMAGFHAVLAADFDVRYPRLRWGFLEGGATWAPAVMQQQARLESSRSEQHFLTVHSIGPEVIERKQMFITCQTDEDIGYLVHRLGKGTLVVGTDYGHNDIGSELGAHQTILGRTDIEAETAQQIVDSNGRRLFGISPEFRPAPKRQAALDPPHVHGANTRDGRPRLFA